MKLDASALRYMDKEDFRILSALEVGSRNHEVVPLSLLAKLTKMRPGGINGRMLELAKNKLVSKENHSTPTEGFRLTYGGYDYLALHSFSQRGTIESVSRQIGVGKEADVYLVNGRRLKIDSDADTDTETNQKAVSKNRDEDSNARALRLHLLRKEEEREMDGNLEVFIVKIERLGRTSFRTVKTNRDYQGNRKHISWMYLSKLAAEKEWAFLQALHSQNLPTPTPIDYSRHCIVMEYIPGLMLEQCQGEHFLNSQEIIESIFSHLMNLILKIANLGLVHGDFNEFNLVVRQEYLDAPYVIKDEDDDEDDADCVKGFNSKKSIKSPIIMIDFPQMISCSHINAEELFDRDVHCLEVFFERKFSFKPQSKPSFKDDVSIHLNIDKKLCASGFNRKVLAPLSAESDVKSNDDVMGSDGDSDDISDDDSDDVSDDVIDDDSDDDSDDEIDISSDISD